MASRLNTAVEAEVMLKLLTFTLLNYFSLVTSEKYLKRERKIRQCFQMGEIFLGILIVSIWSFIKDGDYGSSGHLVVTGLNSF